jgi:Tfp pilus assembly protein PilN
MSIMQSQESFVGVGTPVRMPRVNLLPPEILEGRRLRRTKVVLGGSLVLVVAGLVGAYALQVSATNKAQDELDAAKAENATLVQAQAKYADVPRTIRAIDAAETTRELAMANDVEWYRTLTNISLTQPSNVWLTKLTLQVSTPDAPAATGAAGSAVPAAGFGTVTAEGSAIDHRDVATWLDTLGGQPGMTDAYFSSSEKALIGSKVVVDFKSTANLTSDALSHRYDRKKD